MGVEGVARTELRLLFFQEEGGMRVVEMFRGLGVGYKRQGVVRVCVVCVVCWVCWVVLCGVGGCVLCVCVCCVLCVVCFVLTSVAWCGLDCVCVCGGCCVLYDSYTYFILLTTFSV